MRYFSIETFYSSLYDLRLELVLIMENGQLEVWCTAMDICKFLGYKNVEQSIVAVPNHLRKRWGELNVDRGNTMQWMINMNSLILLGSSLKKESRYELFKIYTKELVPYVRNLKNSLM